MAKLFDDPSILRLEVDPAQRAGNLVAPDVLGESTSTSLVVSARLHARIIRGRAGSLYSGLGDKGSPGRDSPHPTSWLAGARPLLGLSRDR